MKILLIDDDPSFSQTVCKFLYEAKNDIDYCETLQSTFSIIEKNQYDLVMIDLMLPPTFREEGITILKHISDIQTCDVVMISSQSVGMTSLVDEAYQLGARRFLDKNDSNFFVKLMTIIEEVRVEMSDSIFISHGHADLLKYQLKDFVREKLGKTAVVLSEQPNNGMTIVEKLEAASEKCNKAIILLTKDDEMADGKMRGRQNVIHEIGFFQGKYGRRNVILLQEEGVESFTNISGIVYIQFNRDHFSEVFEPLRNELM